MRVSAVGLLVILAFSYALATVHFVEEFKDDSWENRWVKSTKKESEGAQGKWEFSAGEWYGDAVADKGIKTSEDSRFYGISAEFPKFSNRDKTLVIQYQVKFTQKIDCGGGYVKVGPSPFPGKDFHGETPYNIMFGPDFCGYSTKKVHVIFNYKGKNHLIKKTIAPKEDQLSHVYTLIVKPDNSYEVLIDNANVAEGKLPDDWDFLPPKQIPDPNDKKPSDWVDDPEMDDPTDKKPAGYDDIPKQIKDPEAKKPDDWDDALDGEWEAPLIDNPEYKGEWKPKRIPNPAYKGRWEQKQIPNPEYKDDNSIYAYDDFSFLGIDVWQVKSGTIFDNFLITDDPAYAKEFANNTWKKSADAEKKAFDEIEAAKTKTEEAEAAAHGEDHEDHEDL
jgi:calreticulin